MYMATHAYGNTCYAVYAIHAMQFTHAFVVLFHSSNYYKCPAYLFHVISISHGILASY